MTAINDTRLKLAASNQQLIRPYKLAAKLEGSSKYCEYLDGKIINQN